jgi:uncharacterized protein
MQINVKRIPEEGESLRGSEPGTIMELAGDDASFPSPVEYDLLAQIQGRALLVTGKLWTEAQLRCSRCLKLIKQGVKVPEFVAHQELAGEDFVDLTPQMREDILLQLPQRALCHPDCKGLCPSCGKDLNSGACQCRAKKEDQRWHALDGLKLK